MKQEMYFQSEDRGMNPPKDKMVVGMAYVPDQEWDEIYQVDCGFDRGTIFAELDKPWLVGGFCNE